MNYIDLFAGAGGLSEGFIRCGFQPLVHVESDTAACFTLKTRLSYHWLKGNNQLKVYKDYLRGKITRDELYSHVPVEILSSVINERIGEDTIASIFEKTDRLVNGRNVDVIVGGPPCQAYSVAGRSRDKNRMRDDARNYLYRYYGRFLKRYQPRVFVFENVRGLKSAADGKYLKNMAAYFKRVGYSLNHKVLNAHDFGVLQNRRRILLIGWRKDVNFRYPEFLEPIVRYRVEAVLRDLPVLKDGEGIEKDGRYNGLGSKYLRISGIRNGINILTQHVARPHTEQDKEIYRIAINNWNTKRERLVYSDLPEHLKTHQNEMIFLDRFKVVAGDIHYSQTIVAHICKDGHYYIHPDIEQTRSLTVREAARLQSFPDDYYFEGERADLSRTSAFRQVGNAVPPLMAEKIARRISEMLVK
jgi:DNA (cytosine-5)-methyltransferase 1